MTSINNLGSGSFQNVGSTGLGSTGVGSTNSTNAISKDSITTGGTQDSLDTFSSASAQASAAQVQLDAPSLLDYTQALGSAINLASQTNFSQQAQDDLLFLKFSNSLAADLPQQLADIQKIMTIQNGSAYVFQLESSDSAAINFNISVFNSEVASTDIPPGNDALQLQKINTAIAEYNNGSITAAQFQAAANTYDVYATARNAQIASFAAPLQQAYSIYNQQVPSLNAQIAIINTDLKFANQTVQIPTLSNEPAPTTSLSLQNPNPTSFPIPTLSGISTIPNFVLPPNPIMPTNAQLFAGLDVLLAAAATLNQQYQTYNNHISYIQYYQQGTLPQLPNSYITPIPAAYVNATGSAGSSSASFGAVLTSLDNPKITSVLSTNLFSLAAHSAIYDESTGGNSQANIEALNGVIPQIQSLLLQQLIQSGIFSSPSALQTLSSNFSELGNNPTAVSAAIGLAFTQQISALVASGVLRPAIQKILQGSGLSLDADGLDKTTDSLTAIANLTLLKVGVSQLGQSLGLPNLPAQVFGSLQSPPPPPSSQPSVSDILANQVSVGYLKDQLGQQLINNDVLTSANAQAIVNASVKAALANNDIQTTDQLKTALTAQLTQNQISQENANLLSSLASSYVQSEINSNYALDSLVNQETINRQALTSSIVNQTNLNSDVANQAVNQAVVSSAFTSQRELRDSLVDALDQAQINQTQLSQVQSQTQQIAAQNQQSSIQNQLNQTLAQNQIQAQQTITQNQISPINISNHTQNLLAATQAVTEQALQNATPPALSATVAPTVAAQKQQINTAVIKSLNASYGTTKATEYANNVYNTLLDPQNPQSFLRQTQDQVAKVNQFKQTAVDQAVQDNLAEAQKTNVDFYTFNKLVQSPADNMVHSMWTSIMYQGETTFPTNFQHALQFNV